MRAQKCLIFLGRLLLRLSCLTKHPRKTDFEDHKLVVFRGWKRKHAKETKAYWKHNLKRKHYLITLLKTLITSHNLKTLKNKPETQIKTQRIKQQLDPTPSISIPHLALTMLFQLSFHFLLECHVNRSKRFVVGRKSSFCLREDLKREKEPQMTNGLSLTHRLM